MAHFAVGQNRTLGFFHRFAVAAVDQPAGGIAAYFCEIFAGEHRQNTGHRLGRCRVDRIDPAIGHFGPRKHRVGLPCQNDVIGIFSAARQEPHVFAPLGAGANASVFRHDIVLPGSALQGLCLFGCDIGNFLSAGRHDRLDDIVVARAPADIAAQIISNLRLGRRSV